MIPEPWQSTPGEYLHRRHSERITIREVTAPPRARSPRWPAMASPAPAATAGRRPRPSSIFPEGVAVDSSGDIFIADTGNSEIREVSAAIGKISTVAGTGTVGASGNGGPATAAELNAPTNVAIDSAGDVYIADSNNNEIREVGRRHGQNHHRRGHRRRRL